MHWYYLIIYGTEDTCNNSDSYSLFFQCQRAEKSTKSVPRAADILLRQGRLRAEAYRQKGGSQPTIGKIMTLNLRICSPIRSHRFTVGQHSTQSIPELNIFRRGRRSFISASTACPSPASAPTSAASSNSSSWTWTSPSIWDDNSFGQDSLVQWSMPP